MPRPAELAWLAMIALMAARPALAEDMESFLGRHDLRSTRVQWWLHRLRQGDAAARDAARALASDDAWHSEGGGLDPVARRETLAAVIAAVPATDVAAASPRLELARRELGRVASDIDAMRGRAAAVERLRDATLALQQVGELLAPLLSHASQVDERAPDPMADWRPPARLLDAWARLLKVWIARRGPEGAPDAGSLELERLQVILARLLDADDRFPMPENASGDLLRSEGGAEAALGLMVTLAMQGRGPEAASWAEAIRRRAATTAAAGRLAVWQLALAVDARDVLGMRRAMEAMPPRTLSGELAMAAASVAAESGSRDGEVVLAAAIEAMPTARRTEWMRRLAAGSGRWSGLASAVMQASEGLPAWREGRSDGAAAAASMLVRSIADAPEPPPALHAEALRLLGWSSWRAGRWAEASVAFERAASLAAPLRPECLWLAAISLPEGQDSERRVTLLKALRSCDPEGPYAGRAATWLSRLDAFPGGIAAVAALLEIPVTDPFVVDARCEAARRLLRQSADDRDARAEAASRVLRILEPVRHASRTAPWRLVAAMTPGVEDGAEATQAFSALQVSDRGDPAVAAAIARWRALQRDLEGVQAAVAEARPEFRCQVALRAAVALADVPGAEARDAEARLSVMAARTSDAGLQSAAADRLAATVLAMAESGGSLEPSLAGDVVAVLRTSPRASERSGAIAEALRAAGESEEAVEVLQAWSAVSAQGSPAWLQARWLLLRALESLDADRARAMLSQHLALLPDGGAEPWGSRFMAAARRLGVRP